MQDEQQQPDLPEPLTYQPQGKLGPQPVPLRLVMLVTFGAVLTVASMYLWSAHEISWFKIYNDGTMQGGHWKDAMAWCVKYPCYTGVGALFAIFVAALISLCKGPPGKDVWRNIAVMLRIVTLAGVIHLLVMAVMYWVVSYR